MSLTPPPVAPRPAPSFHTVSLTGALAASSCTVVPPQANACGLDAGKSTCTAPSVAPSLLPLSPDATQTLTPRAAASMNAWSSAVRAWAVHASSLCPQLMLTAVGVGVACTAVATASRKPRSVFGAKYTTRVAFGASAPATSMSNSTSPSAPWGSLPAPFTPPSTPTALTAGVPSPRPVK